MEIIEFDIERHSAALWEIICAKGWQNQRIFSLPTRRGPFLSLLMDLIPNLLCEFHVGCVLDQRPPNFGYQGLKKEVGENKLTFYYWRDLTSQVFAANKWFHDAQGLRDLEAVAVAMSDPQNYEEVIGFAWQRPDGKFSLCSQIKLHFEKETWIRMENLEVLQKPFFRSLPSGLEGSIFNLTEGPLSSKREKLLEYQGLPATIFIENGISAEQAICELLRFFGCDF